MTVLPSPRAANPWILLQIVLWSVGEQRPLWTLPTLGGHVFAVAVDPADGACVAIGAGDGVIRLWQPRTTRSCDVRALWRGVQGRVRTVRPPALMPYHLP